MDTVKPGWINNGLLGGSSTVMIWYLNGTPIKEVFGGLWIQGWQESTALCAFHIAAYRNGGEGDVNYNGRSDADLFHVKE